MSPDRLAAHLAWFLACLLTFVVETSTNNSTQWPEGHLEVLGRHRPSDGHIEILDTLPTPEEFWEKYAKNGVPVLFRGMSDNFAARQKWTDEYLLSNYGKLRVKIEAKAEKEYYPEGDKGVGQDTLQHFLETYQSRNAYVVSQLPDPMSKEVSVPPFMTCGTFGERLLEANLWFSSGGTKSLLHRDADNAINCLLFGTKDWIFIHPDHEDKIPIAKEAAQGYGGFALLNPDSVDLLAFPKFADVTWTHGNVTAGDCIFLPQGYWHQVRSYGSRNLAVSLLFSRLREVDLSDCEGARLSYKPLSEMEMVFTYDGFGEQTMGDTDPFELNDTIKEWCQGTENGRMDSETIFDFLMKEYDNIWEDQDDDKSDDSLNGGGAGGLQEYEDEDFDDGYQSGGEEEGDTNSDDGKSDRCALESMEEEEQWDEFYDDEDAAYYYDYQEDEKNGVCTIDEQEEYEELFFEAEEDARDYGDFQVGEDDEEETLDLEEQQENGDFIEGEEYEEDDEEMHGLEEEVDNQCGTLEEEDEKTKSPEAVNVDAIFDIADKIVEFLDVNRDGYVSCEEVNSLGLKALKALANIIDRDPANTEEYEYARFEPQDIGVLMQEVVQEVQKIGEDSVTRQDFVIAYQNIGGSFKIGNEVFSKLVNNDSEDVVGLDQFQQSVEEISELFSKKMKHEAVDLRWQEEGKEWMTQTRKHPHTEL